MSVTFRPHGIPGISVRTSADTPDFAELVAAHLGHQPRGIAATQMHRSMLLKNQSGKQIISLTVACESDGEHPGYTYFGTFPFRRGPYIKPGDEVLSFTQVALAKQQAEPAEEELGIGELYIEVGSSPPIETSIWIDSVLFEDGSFFGLDKADSLHRLRSAVEMYISIFDRVSGLSETEGLKTLNDLMDESAATGKQGDPKYSMGAGKALRGIWFSAQNGFLRQALEEKRQILACVGPIH